MDFAKEMLETQKILEELGFKVLMPIDTQVCFENPEAKLNESIEHCLSYGDIDKDHFNKISTSDAILVLNYPKNNIKGYVGGATLMEIGIARHLDKKIFLLYDLPSESELRYVLEIKLTSPVILKGEIKKITNF